MRRTRQSRRLSASSSAVLLYQDYPGTSYEIRLLPCAAWRDFRVDLKWGDRVPWIRDAPKPNNGRTRDAFYTELSPTRFKDFWR